MTISQTLLRIKKLDNLIKQGNTGSATILSKELSVSTRSVHSYLMVLRATEGPIVYDRGQKSYRYELSSE